MISLDFMYFSFILFLVLPRCLETYNQAERDVLDSQGLKHDTATTVSSSLGMKCLWNSTFLISLKKEIESYQATIDKIINAVTKGQLKGTVYKELAVFADKFGNRLSGTKNLEDSLDYVIKLFRQYNLDNVHAEPVTVPHWTRGFESAYMILPKMYKLKMLGLGGSIGTPSNGITGEVLVVKSFTELHQNSAKAKGKIIVFNPEWVSYEINNTYRISGATAAAKFGAVAALIRSVTPFSLYSPHTGWQVYNETITKIPVGAITVEDADLLQRISDRGEKIVVKLFMGAETLPDTVSKNVVADLTGKRKKKEIVLLSGHLDSWDVGQGVVDDAAGAFVSWFSLVVLKHLGLKPDRTIRAVMWTAEESGFIGAKQYIQTHKKELHNYNLVMESDWGTFTPLGIQFNGGHEAACIMREIAQLLKPLNATSFSVLPEVGSDIIEFSKFGVPAADLINKNERYHWYHHTEADTMTAINSDDLDRTVAVFAAVSYVTSNLSQRLPRKDHQNFFQRLKEEEETNHRHNKNKKVKQNKN